MTFVLFHGSFNSYDQVKQFWFPKLIVLNQKIVFPHFPTSSWDEITAAGQDAILQKQNLNSWLNVFDVIYSEIKNEKDLIFVGHSSGPLFILHVLEKYKLQLDSAVFVSPFLNPLTKPAWQVKLINNSYYSDKFNFTTLRKLCPFSYVMFGVDDPYIETGNTLNFAKKMHSTVIPVAKGGHLNTERNSQLIIELCKSRINN